MTVIPQKKLVKIVSNSLKEWLTPLGFAKEDCGGVDGGGVFRWQGDVYTFIGCRAIRIGGENQIVPFGQMGFLHRKKSTPTLWQIVLKVLQSLTSVR